MRAIELKSGSMPNGYTTIYPAVDKKENYITNGNDEVVYNILISTLVLIERDGVEYLIPFRTNYSKLITIDDGEVNDKDLIRFNKHVDSECNKIISSYSVNVDNIITKNWRGEEINIYKYI